MGRRKERQDWEPRVRELTENNPKWGSRRIASELETRFGAGAPSPRTIDRIIKEHRASVDQRDYRYVYWPESFDRGDLAWEVAPVALELLRWNHHISPPWPIDAGPEWAAKAIDSNQALHALVEYGITNRPTVRLTRWLHRVSQAAPDSPFDWRLTMASHLGACEGLGIPPLAESTRRAVEARIVTMFHADFSVFVPTSGKNEEAE